MNRANWAAGVAVAVAVVGAAVYLWSDDADDEPRRNRPTAKGKGGPDGTRQKPGGTSLPEDESVVTQLRGGGWPRELAEEFDRLNAECWRAKTAWEAVADQLLPRVAALGRSAKAMAVIGKRPHLAMLLAWASDPDRLARVLDDLPDARLSAAADLFRLYPVRDDAELLTVALERNAGEVLGLAEKNLFAPELLFMFRRDTTAANEYAGWLGTLVRDDLLPGVEATDGQKALFTFLAQQGAGIRRRMADDSAFGGRFRDLLWPRFRRLAEPAPGDPALWDAYAAVPKLWEILAREPGVGWVEKYYQLPVLLLESGEYPEEFHPFIADALTGDDLEVLLLLEACCGKADLKAEFLDFLRQKKPKLEAATYRAVLTGLLLIGPLPDPPPPTATDAELEEHRQKAAAAQADAVNKRRDKLVWVRGADEPTLQKEFLGARPPFLVTLIPGYGVLNLLDKLVTGRDVEVLDVVDAGFDVVQLRGLALPKAKGLVSKSSAKLVKKEVSDQARKQMSQRMAADVKSSVVRGAALNAVLTSTAARAGSGTRALLKVVTTAADAGKASLSRLLGWQVEFLVTRGGRTLVAINYGGDDLAAALAGFLARQAVKALTEEPATEQEAERAYRRNTHAWWTAQLLRR